MKNWIEAARLRTLPLALSCILMGSFLATAAGKFDVLIFTLSCLTTVLLQVLSNFANDYGDTVNGKDTDARVGPKRQVHAGAISVLSMRRAIFWLAGASFVSGLWLLYEALRSAPPQTFWVFLGVGIGAIIAAITYTAGKNPYGYAGFGDVAVLVFFGWVGVLGSYYLYTLSLDWSLLWPATSCGLFAVGVLNLNNMRDIKSDTLTGKRSIPVRIGRHNAAWYHTALLVVGLGCAIAYVLRKNYEPIGFLFLLTAPLFYLNIRAVWLKTDQHLDPYLKQLALTTLLFVVLFGLGQIWV